MMLKNLIVWVLNIFVAAPVAFTIVVLAVYFKNNFSIPGATNEQTGIVVATCLLITLVSFLGRRVYIDWLKMSEKNQKESEEGNV